MGDLDPARSCLLVRERRAPIDDRVPLKKESLNAEMVPVPEPTLWALDTSPTRRAWTSTNESSTGYTNARSSPW